MQGIGEEIKKIERKILDVILQALDNGQIAEADLQPISAFVLEEINASKDKGQLLSFLEELAKRYSIFQGLVEEEKGVARRNNDSQVTASAEQLIEQGKIDQALELVKKATNDDDMPPQGQ